MQIWHVLKKVMGACKVAIKKVTHLTNHDRKGQAPMNKVNELLKREPEDR
ncbi:hypothetical protein Syun_006635 [Stephania yunnanensis]|uniref:Uncharacterized protein n=1 Tax=Stephania yunnanensis TaxID=152371 RepID=A0AAP0KYN2_9MAGN